MFGTFRRAMQVRMLEGRRRKLEARRDAMIAALCGDGSHLYRHQYPNTPVLEDICLELDYVHEALAGIGGPMDAYLVHQPAT